MERKEGKIRDLELFAGCSGAEVRWVMKHADEVHVRAGSTIVVAGSTAREFCVVLDGFAEADATGAPVALGPGSWFGDVELMTERPNAATIVAKGDVRLLVFGRREFNGLSECAPWAVRKLYGEVAARVPATPVARPIERRLAVA